MTPGTSDSFGSSTSFGLSVSTGCVRGVLVSPDGHVTDAQFAPISMDRPLDSAIEAAADLARTMGRETPVLAVGGDPADTYAEPGARLISECDAFLAAARVDGRLDAARTIAVVDLGRTGTRIHVLDAYTGQLHASSGHDDFSGDGCDMAILDHLAVTYGAAEKMTPDAMSRLGRDCAIAKEMLSDERAVDLSGPFLAPSVRLRRNEFEDIVGPSLLTVIAAVTAAVSADVDAVLLVGGGASIPLVQRAVATAVSVPVITPRWPHLFAAIGAAHLSRVIPVPASPPPVDASLTSASALASATVLTPVAADFAGDDADTTSFAPITAGPAPENSPAPENTKPRLPTPRTPTSRTPAPPTTRRASKNRSSQNRASKNRRRARPAVLVGAAALAAIATFGAVAGASGRGDVEPVRAPDRAVMTEPVDIAAVTEAPTAPPAAPSLEPPLTPPDDAVDTSTDTATGLDTTTESTAPESIVEPPVGAASTPIPDADTPAEQRPRTSRPNAAAQGRPDTPPRATPRPSRPDPAPTAVPSATTTSSSATSTRTSTTTTHSSTNSASKPPSSTSGGAPG